MCNDACVYREDGQTIEVKMASSREVYSAVAKRFAYSKHTDQEIVEALKAEGLKFPSPRMAGDAVYSVECIIKKVPVIAQVLSFIHSIPEGENDCAYLESQKWRQFREVMAEPEIQEALKERFLKRFGFAVDSAVAASDSITFGPSCNNDRAKWICGSAEAKALSDSQYMIYGRIREIMDVVVALQKKAPTSSWGGHGEGHRFH